MFLAHYPTLPCDVCGSEGDGEHYGAYVCKSCSAFFKRATTLNKAYKCSQLHQCRIHRDVPILCKGCRYSKCIKAGMFTSPKSHSYPSASLSLSPIIKSTPILTRMNYHYNILEKVRRAANFPGGLKKRNPRPILYKEIHEIYKIEIPLVSGYIISSFPEYKSLPKEQKIVLFQNLFLAFRFLEGGYSCVQKGSITIMVFSNGDYIDFNNPMHLFDDKEILSAQDTTICYLRSNFEIFHNLVFTEKYMTFTSIIQLLFHNSCEIYQRNVILPMCDHKVTRMEFLYLIAMVLWDRGVLGQTKSCEGVAAQVRDQLTRELLIYYEQSMPNIQSAMRMASLLMIIPNIQATNRPNKTRFRVLLKTSGGKNLWIQIHSVTNKIVQQV